jgi:hypothetical protein
MSCAFVSVSRALLGALVIALLITSEGARADETWQWVRIKPQTGANPVYWEILKGSARVKVNRGTFELEMDYTSGEMRLMFQLHGTIDGKKVTATELQLFTEASPRTYRGDLKMHRSEGSKWGDDEIVLTDGVAYIGLLRRVEQGADPDLIP